ncbi:hypothetical protein E2F46_16740 [Luteimonas aestuarii]|uniref:Peptidase M12B domain-containing protein n=1 Tax=Luteimonas aestuarii TaxID=453837 RepID=A0A4V3AL89_9GAMM|nr:FG-GAP-like repeat-containing protein [Luteimonas aestuarii]TDK19416.1 hypothetical protein E2F46_16740 [Luteimonas aestuarii]
MRIYLAAIALTGTLLAGCSSDWDPARASKQKNFVDSAQGSEQPVATLATRQSKTSFASLPDRGELLNYPKDREVRRSGAYTSYPVEISEAHALNAIAAGGLRLDTPDGKPVNVAFNRIEEHPDGNWSWVGQSDNGDHAVLTFGETAVFGEFSSAGKSYRVTTRRGSAFVVETDPRMLTSNPSHHGDGPEFLIPPDTSSSAASAAGGMVMAAADATVAPKSASAVVDLALGYTAGMVATYGNEPTAISRVTSLVALGNAAYERSGVNMRLRLVHAMRVEYADNTDNADALQKLTGYNSTTRQFTTPDPAFNALRSARDQYGADLVALIRPHRAPEQKGCGIAWLIGANQRPITAADAPFGYSVVSDGSDLDESNSNTYFCSEYSLVHELGHSMGQAHNQENSEYVGAHPYSYGYREAAGNGFHTIMAYPLANNSQTEVPYFATPAIDFSPGRPLGIANVADNVRSLNQTMPVVATFRANVVPVGRKLDVYIVKKSGNGSTEIHSLNRDTNYTTFNRHIASALHTTPSDESWVFLFGDYNGDGVADMYAINKVGASGRTEVHILSGATNFSTFLLNTTTAIHQTGVNNQWEYMLGDYNRDGRPDLYAITRSGASGRVEVHVLNGATTFSTFLLNSATALRSESPGYASAFDLADWNSDGRPDLFYFAKNGSSGRTEVHVLSGADGFSSFLLQTATALGQTGTADRFKFLVGDYNLDGTLDIYVIERTGASGRTEVHVLDGHTTYQSFLLNAASALHQTGIDQAWNFRLVEQN